MVEAEVAGVVEELRDVVAEGGLRVAILHEVAPRAREHHGAHEARDGREAVEAVRRARLHLDHHLARAQRRDHLHDAQRVEQLVERTLFARRAQERHEALEAREQHHADGADGHAARVGPEARRAKPTLMLRDALDHGGRDRTLLNALFSTTERRLARGLSR